MHPTAALLAGLTLGLLIAMQIGPVSLLVVETSVVAGRRAGVAAGMGVASADLAFAAIAAATGGAAGAALAGHEHEIRIAGAILLAAIATSGLVALVRAGASRGDSGGRAVARDCRARTHYGRFLAITMANPLTIVSFGAAAGALTLDGVAAAGGFVVGVGAASAGWHAALGTAAGHAARWMTPRARRPLAIAGRVAILGLAAHLALAA